MTNQLKEPLRYHQYASGKWEKVDSGVIVERAVTLTINGEEWLEFMCTPVNLEALAVGFIYNERLIQTVEEIRHVEVCASERNIDVWLSHAVERPRKWRRTSDCSGGMTSTDAESQPKTTTGSLCLEPEKICTLIEQLLEMPGLYRDVGGVHTSALSDGEQLLIITEDIGYHNTLDKISGRALLEAVNPERRILLTTGRISSEMLQKASRINATVVISRSAPTSLSVQLARKDGITLIGYARRDRFNVYTFPDNIATAENSLCADAPGHP